MSPRLWQIGTFLGSDLARLMSRLAILPSCANSVSEKASIFVVWDRGPCWSFSTLSVRLWLDWSYLDNLLPHHDALRSRTMAHHSRKQFLNQSAASNPCSQREKELQDVDRRAHAARHSRSGSKPSWPPWGWRSLIEDLLIQEEPPRLRSRTS